MLKLFPDSFVYILIITFSKLNFIFVSPCRALCEFCILQATNSNLDSCYLTPWYLTPSLPSKIVPASDWLIILWIEILFQEIQNHVFFWLDREHYLQDFPASTHCQNIYLPILSSIYPFFLPSIRWAPVMFRHSAKPQKTEKKRSESQPVALGSRLCYLRFASPWSSSLNYVLQFSHL